MRLSKGLSITLLAACTTVGWSGCTPTKATEYVSGISTQVQVPRDLLTVRVQVSVGGVSTFCSVYPVFDGHVALPKSLGEFPAETAQVGTPITVTVTGYTEPFTDGKFDNCDQAVVLGVDARILKRSRQPYVSDRILFLPLALHYACWDVNCNPKKDAQGNVVPGEDDGNSTCTGGACVPPDTDPNTLLPYDDSLVDGSSGACFPVSGPTGCMTVTVPASVVNTDTCVFAIPGSASAPPVPTDLGDYAQASPLSSPGDGLNVQVSFDGGFNTEILDLDPIEGFLVPDPAKPQQFQLSPGLCSSLKGYALDNDYKPVLDDKTQALVQTPHRLSAVRVSGACQPKQSNQQLCTADMIAAMGAKPDGSATPSGGACKPVELKPAQAAFVILTDTTTGNAPFYATTAGNLLKVTLADPAYERADLGLVYFPGDVTDATCTGFKPKVDLQTARLAQPLIANAMAELTQGKGLTDTQKPHLASALTETYALLEADAYKDAYQRGVLVITNQSVNGSGGDPLEKCFGVPRDIANGAREKGIRTYVLVSPDPVASPRIPDGITGVYPQVPGTYDLARAGGTAVGSDGSIDNTQQGGPYDLVVSPAAIVQLGHDIEHDLASCAFDVPGSAIPKTDIESAVVTYTDPTSLDSGNPKTFNVAYNKDCTAPGSSAQGWGYVPGVGTTPSRIYICGSEPSQACGNYRALQNAASGVGLSTGQPALPVPVFLHSKGCDPTGNVQVFGNVAGSDAPPAPEPIYEDAGAPDAH